MPRSLAALAAICCALSFARALAQGTEVTVAITPPSTSVFITPATIALTASASVNHPEWSVARVEYFAGAELIGSAASAPYAIAWPRPAGTNGTYAVTAKATAVNRGQSQFDSEGRPNMPVREATSAPVTIIVNEPPTVSIRTSAAFVQAPGTVTLDATASDVDGSIARVDFYRDGTPILSASGTPYSAVVRDLPAGTYSFSAVATDNLGATATSQVGVRVNAPPSVSITSPANNAVLNAPASLTLVANASDSDGAISKVEFYQDAKLLGTATTSPYQFVIANLAAGTYSFTAIASDDAGGAISSAAISVRVNSAPSVSLTSPANASLFNAPATVTLTADASDTDGTVRKVEFYRNSTLVGTVTAAPYSVTIENLGSGAYSLTAVATDNDLAQTTSGAVNVAVNALPTISITSPPISNASFTAPANIPIAAIAGDGDGTVSTVEFYQGSTLITTLSAAPYSFVWTDVPQGSYSLTAKVTDSSGATVTSTPINVTVTAAVKPVAKLHFIHVDHLDTPRLIADEKQQVVWRWDQQEPFGGNVPDENSPSSLGFDFPLRFPGQYFDKETGLHYNYFRHYGAAIGRYVETDPIGLSGGANTYAYAASEPTRKSDFYGLYVCGSDGTFVSFFIPDAFLFFSGPIPAAIVSFHGPCKAHDRCYDNCVTPKSECDHRFFGDMQRKCSRAPIALVQCMLVASTYYDAVSTWGNAAFVNARAKCAVGTCKPNSE